MPGWRVDGRPEPRIFFTSSLTTIDWFRVIKISDWESRLRDLTKGLIAHFEREPALVGPLRADYECVAEHVAKVIAEKVGG